MNLFIGDVHLERIPQYSVRAMKLKFEIIGEEVSILGKWSSKNQIIRFQEMIHISLTSSALAAVKTNVLFTLYALLEDKESESRVIGSGIGDISMEIVALPQTVLLRSSNMTNLMARLLFIVTFDHPESQSSNIINKTDMRINPRAELIQHPRDRVKSTAETTVLSNETKNGGLFSSQHRENENCPRNKDNRRKEGSQSIDRGSFGGIRGREPITQQHYSHADQWESESHSLSSNRGESSLFNSGSSRLETLQQFTDRARQKADQKSKLVKPVGLTNTVQIVHICPDAMKENEACERLREALDKKDEMLRKAQSQLDVNVMISNQTKVKLPFKFDARYHHDRSIDRSTHIHNSGARVDLKESKIVGRLKQAETRRLVLLTETSRKAARLSLDATNKSRTMKAAAAISNSVYNNMRNDLDKKDEILRIAENQLDASIRSLNLNARSGSRNGMKDDALRAARSSLELKAMRREERRALDIKNRLQSAEDRRLRLLREHKVKAAAMASEATCKAEAIKQAALRTSRAYDKLRNDFDRKDEMLRKVQSELDTSCKSVRDRSFSFTRLNRSPMSHLNSSTDNSPIKRRSEAGIKKMRQLRASSAPAHYRSYYRSFTEPFSDPKEASTFGHQDGPAFFAGSKSKRGFQKQFSGNTSAAILSDVHRIPSVSPLKRSAITGSKEDNGKHDLYPPHQVFRRSLSPSHLQHSPSHPFKSKSSRRGTVSTPNELSSGVVDGNVDQSFRYRQGDVKESPSNKSYSSSISYSPGKLHMMDSIKTRTRSKLMRLVHQRIQGLKQKISEVSSSEGEVILRMIRKMLPLTSALYQPKKDGYGGCIKEHKGRKEASTKGRVKNVAHTLTTTDRSDGLPHCDEAGEGTLSKTFNSKEGNKDVDFGDGEDEDSGDDGSINADALVAELWDILGVTADYGSPSKTNYGEEKQQTNAISNARRIDKANESAKRTYDAGKALLTSKYQEIYDQHYRGYSMSAAESSEEVDGSVQSDQFSAENSSKPTYSDGIALYSQSAADLSNSFYRRSKAQPKEGDYLCSQGDSRILSTDSIIPSETCNIALNSQITVIQGQTVRGGISPPLPTQEISRNDQKCEDALNEICRSSRCDDSIIGPGDFSDDSDVDEPFRDSVVNMNDTSACINRQIEDVSKAIGTLQVSYQIITSQPSIFHLNRHNPITVCFRTEYV